MLDKHYEAYKAAHERGRIEGLKEAAAKMRGFVADTHVDDDMYCYEAMNRLDKYIAEQEGK